jgi:hypothetical protein
MLVLVLPSQVMDFWPIFEGHIERSLPPIASVPGVDVNQILYSLMVGSMQCWLYTNFEQRMDGFILTTTFRDVTDIGTLLLYEVVIFNKEAQVEWKEELETIKKFATARNCRRIAAFIANKKVLSALESWGVNTSFTFATLDI